MTEKPKRRWVRFRLSTVLILTAILAWGMALRVQDIEFKRGWFPPPHAPSSFHIIVHLFAANGTSYTVNWHLGLQRALLGPLAALVAFLAWKAAWTVVERGRRKSAAPE